MAVIHNLSLYSCIPDLLPGIPYTLPWPDADSEPTIVYPGSRDAVGVAAR